VGLHDGPQPGAVEEGEARDVEADEATAEADLVTEHGDEQVGVGQVHLALQLQRDAGGVHGERRDVQSAGFVDVDGELGVGRDRRGRSVHASPPGFGKEVRGACHDRAGLSEGGGSTRAPGQLFSGVAVTTSNRQ
jgi:hypothetical protein